MWCCEKQGYPEGHPEKIKKVEEGKQLSPSELKRVVTLEDGQYVCTVSVCTPAPHHESLETVYTTTVSIYALATRHESLRFTQTILRRTRQQHELAAGSLPSDWSSLWML